MPISLDLNHREQLGTLEELWTIVTPHVHHFEIVILSLEQLNGLAQLLLPSDQAVDQAALTAQSTDDACTDVMGALQLMWGCSRVSLCRKVRSSEGVQRRWSLLTMLDGRGGHTAHSTAALPVWHVPKDECGGGSAWAAGFIHAMHVDPARGGSAEAVGVADATRRALRRADLLSALCQESEGDFSTVTASELAEAEARFDGVDARLPGTQAK